MQAVSGRHGLAAPVPTSCAVAHPSSPAFMLGTIPHLAQEQYSTLSIPTNPRQTQPLRPPGMQLAAVLPHDLFLCINSKKKKSQKPCKQPLQTQACCTYQVCDGGLARWQLGPGWGPWWWGWRGAAGGQWRARASWGRGACNRDGASAAHQHTSTQILLPGAGGEGTGCPHLNSPMMVAPEQQVCTVEHAVIAAVLVGMTPAPTAWQLYPSWRK